MSEVHNQLKKNLINAVDALNADKSVSIRTTIDSFEEVSDYIDGCIEALDDDLKAGRE